MRRPPMSPEDQAAILADPRNLRRWHRRMERYTDPNACWIYGGTYEQSRNTFQVFINGARRAIPAHRMSLLVKLGRPIVGFACHACDRGGCVNPTCLWEGSALDNMRDASAKGRLGCKHDLDWEIGKAHHSVAFAKKRLAQAKARLAWLKAEKAAIPPPSIPRPMIFGRPRNEGAAA